MAKHYPIIYKGILYDNKEKANRQAEKLKKHSGQYVNNRYHMRVKISVKEFKI